MTQPGQSDTPQHKTSKIEPLQAQSHVTLATDSVLLDRYKVIGLLGCGGMGSVFHVKHLHLQSEFALKVLNRQADDTLWRRFENEARAASRLDHPNLIKVYDSGLLPDGQPFFVMEFVKGQTLSDLIAKHGRLPLRKALKIFIQVGFALAYAHDNGVIHRDLKPSNIMLTRGIDGSVTSAVKVVDLGIAKLTGADEFNQQTLTRTGEIFGSPLYMSPEQCMGTGVDSRSDLYSLGCSIYESLTGAPPFIGENALSTMMKHQMEKPLSLKEASMGIEFPLEVERLVAKLLEKDPLSRYLNAQLLTADLVKIEQELGDLEFSQITHPKSAIVQKIEETGAGAFFNRHYVTFFLMILSYVLGWATHPQQKVEVQKVAAPAQESAKMFAMFPDGKSERSPSKPPVEKQSESYFSELSADGKTRCFKFPITPVGEIYINGSRHAAVGNLVLPANQLIALKPHPRYLDSGQLLKRFRPEEIVGLHLCDPARNSIDVFEILPRFKKLESLQIAMYVDDQVVKYIDQLPNLSYLDVDSTRMTGAGVARLKRLPVLTVLHCDTLENIHPLVMKLPTTRLTALSIETNGLDESDLKEIAKIKTLEMLQLSGNEKIDDKALLAIGDLKNLHLLSLQTCPITGKSKDFFKRFKKLQLLSISGANWTPQELDYLRKSTNASVDVRGNPK